MREIVAELALDSQQAVQLLADECETHKVFVYLSTSEFPACSAPLSPGRALPEERGARAQHLAPHTQAGWQLALEPIRKLAYWMVSRL